MLKTGFTALTALLTIDRHARQARSLGATSLLVLSMVMALSAQAQSSSTDIAQQTSEAAGSQDLQPPVTGESLDAQRQRGESLITGSQTDSNKQEGLKLLESAIEKGDRKSLIVLGRLYMDGLFLQLDRRRALELFQRAAQAGDFEGLEALGETLMWEGKTADDRREAERLLTMAGNAGRGSAWTTLAFGAIYDKLDSVATSKYETYLQKGRAAGDPQIEIVETERLLYRTGPRGEPGQALALLEKAASAGNPDAIKYLIKLRRDGNSYNIKQNLTRARAYLSKYGSKLPADAQQQQALLLRAAVARTRVEFAGLSQTVRARPDFTSTDFQRQIFQANSNFSIYLVQEKLKDKNLYQGPLNGRATAHTIATLRSVCKTLVWKGDCDKKILSDRSLAAFIVN